MKLSALVAPVAALILAAATPASGAKGEFALKTVSAISRFNGLCAYILAPSAHPTGPVGLDRQCHDKQLHVWNLSPVNNGTLKSHFIGLKGALMAANVPSYPFGEALWFETSIVLSKGTGNVSYSPADGFLVNGLGFLACEWNHDFVPQLFVFSPAGNGGAVTSNCGKIKLIKG